MLQKFISWFVFKYLYQNYVYTKKIIFHVLVIYKNKFDHETYLAKTVYILSIFFKTPIQLTRYELWIMDSISYEDIIHFVCFTSAIFWNIT